MRIILALMVMLYYTSAEAKMFPLPVRLNNPCAITKSADEWHGEARLQTDKKFVRFLSPKMGLRAAMKVLLTYEDIHGLNTIQRIMFRWAPPSENNTEAYIRDVSHHTGISPNTFIDLSQPEMLMAMAQAIVMHENGTPPLGMPHKWYEEVTYHEAAMMALQEVDE